MLIRRRKNVIADFSGLPPAPTFSDVSAIGRLIVDDFLNGIVRSGVHRLYRILQHPAPECRHPQAAAIGSHVRGRCKSLNVNPSYPFRFYLRTRSSMRSWIGSSPVYCGPDLSLHLIRVSQRTCFTDDGHAQCHRKCARIDGLAAARV